MICSLFLSFKFFSFRDKARRLSVRMIKWVWADLDQSLIFQHQIKFLLQNSWKNTRFYKMHRKEAQLTCSQFECDCQWTRGHVARVPGVTGRGWGPGCWRPSLGACRDPSAATCRTWTGAGTRGGCRPAGGKYCNNFSMHLNFRTDNNNYNFKV